MYNFLLLLVLILLFCDKTYEYTCGNPNDPILIVISMDGFKDEYFTRGVTPNLVKFRENGVHIKNLTTPFHSNALQAHHTIATGYYSGKHGVIGHITWALPDPANEDGETFMYNKELYSFDKTIYPIWTLNQFNGGRSGCVMWPGSEFEYGNESPAFLMKYDTTIPIKKRFETIVEWLNSSIMPPNLIMVYIEEPDRMAHIYGPDSPEVNSIIKEIDDAQGYLYKKIDELHLQARVNIIYLSDHGGIEPVKYSDMIDANNSHNGNCEGSQMIYFINAAQQEIVGTPMNNNTCYDFFIYSQNYYYIASPDPEYNRLRCPNNVFATAPNQAWLQYMKKYIKISEEKNRTPTGDTIFGAHGYKYIVNDAILMAKGPVFTHGLVKSPIEMVDFYELFTYILGIPGNYTHDGKFSRVLPLLRKSNNDDMIDWIPILIMIAVCAVIHCTIFYFAVNIYIAKKKADLLKRTAEIPSNLSETILENNSLAENDISRPGPSGTKKDSN